MIEPLLQAERLLLHGMVEQADQIYRRVAEQDPRNSIAVVGLARVALERGDDEAALGHARAALVIDPENAAAIRLEARLGEVLAERARVSADRAVTSAQPSEQDSRPPLGPTAGDAPAWSSTSPTPAPNARPSEAAIFTRNPSMADHRRHEATGEATALPASEERTNTPPAQARRRRGWLHRLLGRKGGD